MPKTKETFLEVPEWVPFGRKLALPTVKVGAKAGRKRERAGKVRRATQKGIWELPPDEILRFAKGIIEPEKYGPEGEIVPAVVDPSHPYQRGQAAVKAAEEMLAQMKQTPTQIDLSSLASLANVWARTPKKFEYTPPQTPEKKMMDVVGLTRDIQKQRLDLENRALEAVRASKMGQAVTLEELTAKEVAQTGTIGQGGAALDYRKTQDHERMVERLAKATGQYVPGVVKELGELDALIKGINNVTNQENIPGIGAGVVIPDPGLEIAYGEEEAMRARRIRQVSLSLYRAMVYLSTGKQININEAKDMMKIVGLGFGKTDSAFRLGMQGVKDKLIAIIRSMQAGYPRSVVDTFHQRGGYTFEDLQKFGYNKADKGKNLIPWGYKLKREGQEVSFRDLPVDPNWRQEMSARRGAATDPRKRRSTTPAPQTQEDRDLINEMRGIQKEINRLKALEGEK